MLTLLIPLALLAAAAVLLAWDRRLAKRMSPSERERGRRKVGRLYLSWQFLTAFVAFDVAMASLLSKQWSVLVIAVVVRAATAPLAVARWRSLQRQS